jgi:hypothetical protein
MGWVTTLAKIARLMLQLIEIRPDGKVAVDTTSLLDTCPVSARSGEGGSLGTCR